MVWANPKSGVYKITNKNNGKFYIGSAVNIQQRWSIHTHLLNSNKHSNPHLQNSWNKNQSYDFNFEILEEVNEKEKLVEREQNYIDTLKPEYNICKIAYSRLGTKHSEQSKELFSKLNSKENNPMYGKIPWNKGKPMSAETKEKISNSMKGEKCYLFGKKRSEETKFKISETRGKNNG